MCKWLKDEVCVNSDCPAVADFCPVVNHPGVCVEQEVRKWMNLKSLFTATRNGNLAEVSAGGIYRTARIASGSWG